MLVIDNLLADAAGLTALGNGKSGKCVARVREGKERIPMLGKAFRIVSLDATLPS